MRKEFFVIDKENSDADKIIVEVLGYQKNTYIECHFSIDGSTATSLRFLLESPAGRVREFTHYLGVWDDSFDLSAVLEDEHLYISFKSSTDCFTLIVKNQLGEGLVFDLIDDGGNILQELGYATEDDIISGGQ